MCNPCVSCMRCRSHRWKPSGRFVSLVAKTSVISAQPKISTWKVPKEHPKWESQKLQISKWNFPKKNPKSILKLRCSWNPSAAKLKSHMHPKLSQRKLSNRILKTRRSMNLNATKLNSCDLPIKSTSVSFFISRRAHFNWSGLSHSDFPKC